MTDIKTTMVELDIETGMRMQGRDIGDRDGDRETDERHRYGLILSTDTIVELQFQQEQNSKQAKIQNH